MLHYVFVVSLYYKISDLREKATYFSISASSPISIKEMYTHWHINHYFLVVNEENLSIFFIFFLLPDILSVQHLFRAVQLRGSYNS